MNQTTQVNNLKNLLTSIVALSAIALAGCQPTSVIPQQPTKPVLEQQVNQTLIVMFSPDVNMTQLNQVIAAYQGTVIHRYTIIQGMAIRFPTTTNIAQAMMALKNVQGVTNVEKDTVQTIQPVTPIIKQ